MQEGKLKSPFEIPIISLKGNPSEGLSSETLSTDSPKASINFDMSVVRPCVLLCTILHALLGSACFYLKALHLTGTDL